MNIYSWQDTSIAYGEKEIQIIAIVVAHITSLHVYRWSWDTTERLQYCISIQTGAKCWQRNFATFGDAMIEYEELSMQIHHE